MQLNKLESAILEKMFNLTFMWLNDEDSMDIVLDIYNQATEMESEVSDVSHQLLDLSLEFKFYNFGFETFSIHQDKLVRNKTVQYFPIFKDFAIYTRDCDNKYLFQGEITWELRKLLDIAFDRLVDVTDEELEFKLFTEFFTRSIITSRQNSYIKN